MTVQMGLTESCYINSKQFKNPPSENEIHCAKFESNDVLSIITLNTALIVLKQKLNKKKKKLKFSDILY